MKRILAVVVCLAFVLGACPTVIWAAENTEDIIILYENDVHCEVTGYSKLAALKNELLQTHAYVGVVSSGDYVQGSSLGVISRGEYIINLMNLVGYDAVTLGNHEFDYHLSRLDELVDMMDTEPVCCNFQQIGEDQSYFDPYIIISYGDTDVAFVGITTPSTMTSSSPAQFKDEEGNFIFTFHGEDFERVVQDSIDAALADGADYVIALSHVGDQEPVYDIETLIAGTSGLDAVLDAHSHSVIEQRIVCDKEGDEVVLSSTGTKFQNIGKMTISEQGIKTELIPTAEYTLTDPTVDAYLRRIDEEYSSLGDRKVAFSEVELITHDAQGNRLVRIAETNLGDFCADAYRRVTGADIGYVNGGGLRDALPTGDITFNDLLNLHPFNNQVVVAEISGQVLKDMMEMAMMNWPMEDGSFPHLSGMTFSVNTSIPSSVVLNAQEEFSGVSGAYRVYDIRVFNKDTQAYEPLVLTDTYTIASTNYFLLEYGSGMVMLQDAKILMNDGMLDVEAIERYISEHLGGVIGQQYKDVNPNITFTEGEPIPPEEETTSPEEGTTSPEEEDSVLWVVGLTGGLVILLLVAAWVFLRIRKNKSRIPQSSSETDTI